MKCDNTVSAIITGAGSGMGEASARLLHAAGVTTILLDRNLEAVAKVADELGALALSCDVSDEASVESAFASIAKDANNVRVCINCAGVAPAKRMVGRQGMMPLGDFKQVIDINLIGSFNIMRHAASLMSELSPLDEETGERGVIINTASVAAFEGQVGQTAYSASKGGVVAMTLPAARELASLGIRVMTIAPGIIGTPMITAMPDEVQASLASSIPFPKRLGKPHEYAHLVKSIIENPLLNGSVIRLDGAIRMQPK